MKQTVPLDHVNDYYIYVSNKTSKLSNDGKYDRINDECTLKFPNMPPFKFHNTRYYRLLVHLCKSSIVYVVSCLSRTPHTALHCSHCTAYRRVSSGFVFTVRKLSVTV